MLVKYSFIKFSGLKLGEHVRRAVGSTIASTSAVSGNSFIDLSEHMCKYLLCAKSDSTTKSYFYSFKRWKAFIAGHGHSEMPAQSIHVALYITHLLDTGASSHTVNAAVYSIKWAHEISGFRDPTDNAFVKSLQESAKRLTGKLVKRKDPVDTGILQQLCSTHKNNADLLTVRNVTMILIAFAGFLRFDELSHLQCKDIIIHDNYLALKISKCKNDQYRQGNEILISKGHTCACPYVWYLKYVEIANIDIHSDHFVFKPIFKSKGSSKLIYKNKSLSYTSTRQHVVSLLSSVAPDLNIGLHSLRAGGATVAANSHVQERCIKRHGRWKTTSSKDRYIVDSVDDRLAISKNLGL